MQQLEGLKHKMLMPTPNASPIEGRRKTSQDKVVKKGQQYIKNQAKDPAAQFEFRDDEVEYKRHLDRFLQADRYSIEGPLITEEEE